MQLEGVVLRLGSTLTIAAIMFGAAGSADASSIGTITEVVNQAFRTPPGASEVPAKAEDSLVADEALRTEKDSTISVLFVDGSELSLEGGSEVLLSDYVIDTGTAASSGVIELQQGLFHYDSNGTADSGIVLQTPIATIGIRGTEFLVTVADGATIVDIVDGEVEVTPRNGGIAARCVGGQSALVSTEITDATCGDFGSFTTAAGLPSAPPSVVTGEARGVDPNAPDRPTRERAGTASPGDKPDNGPSQDSGNRSGHGDGTNPGKGGGQGRSNDNGGSNNPGGSK